MFYYIFYIILYYIILFILYYIILFIFYYIILYYIISYYIILYYILYIVLLKLFYILYYMILYYNFYYILLYHIILYHLILYHFILYHISYYIILYYIIHIYIYMYISLSSINPVYFASTPTSQLQRGVPRLREVELLRVQVWCHIWRWNRFLRLLGWWSFVDFLVIFLGDSPLNHGDVMGYVMGNLPMVI